MVEENFEFLPSEMAQPLILTVQNNPVRVATNFLRPIFGDFRGHFACQIRGFSGVFLLQKFLETYGWKDNISFHHGGRKFRK